MLSTAQAFIDEMGKAGLKYKDARDLEDGKSLVACGVSGRNNAKYDVLFIFDQDEKSVCVRIFKLVTFPEERTEKMFDTVNELNGKFRWVKFCVDHDCNVNVQEDAMLSPDSCGEFCVRLLLRQMQIIDKAYPDLMRALWA